MVIFEETYIQINQGNLSAMHWNQVWRDFVIATSAQYTMKQCQDKITNIKRKIEARVGSQKSSGGVNSKWHHFDLANRIWRSIPKQTEIPHK
jgi:hypothetical protein